MDIITNQEKLNIEDENQHIEYVEEIKIVTRGVDFSVRELQNLREEAELIVPEFQRELVWDTKRKSRFIESILLGYPIPGMFFTDINDGVMMIIDGQQRINTLIEFMQNDLMISNTEDINPKWRGKKYNEIDIDSQRKLRSTNIRASVFQILTVSDEEKQVALYSLFERINTGSIQLNSQEIRRAIYFGDFTRGLNEFVENPIWKMAYKMVNYDEATTIEKDKRLNDQEIIARYFTLKNLIENGTPLGGSISYKKEINKYMAQSQKFPLEKISYLFFDLKEKLEWLQTQMDTSIGILFRRHTLDKINGKSIIDDSKSKKFNIPLFEAILLNMDKVNYRTKQLNMDNFISLFEDEAFIESISSQTNRLEKINYRLDIAERIFE